MNTINKPLVVFCIVLAVFGRTITSAQGQTEAAAWDSAVKTGSATSYGEFVQKYPNSAHITTKTGTVRGRFWFSLGGKQQGVLVTVEGMKVLVSLSLEEAIKLNVIASRQAEPGLEFKGKCQTFDWTYGELLEGETLSHSDKDNTVIAPKDSLNATVVLSSDEKQLLTWDVSKAETAKKPDNKPTFIPGIVSFKEDAAAAPGGLVLDKGSTPKSQSFTVTVKSNP